MSKALIQYVCTPLTMWYTRLILWQGEHMPAKKQPDSVGGCLLNWLFLPFKLVWTIFKPILKSLTTYKKPPKKKGYKY